jgi:hypothetical protein
MFSSLGTASNLSEYLVVLTWRGEMSELFHLWWFSIWWYPWICLHNIMWFLCFRQYSTVETALQTPWADNVWTAMSSRVDEVCSRYYGGTVTDLFSLFFFFLSFLFWFSFIFNQFIILNPQPPVSGLNMWSKWYSIMTLTRYSEGQNHYNVSSISSKSTITLDQRKV